MKILLLGSGGREAALAWKMAQSPLVREVFVVPGNPGMTGLSPKIVLAQAKERPELLALSPDLVVVGPEGLLAEGIVDFFEEHRVPIVGPSKSASLLESSKDFCKEIMVEADIPTASYETVTSVTEGLKIIELWPRPEMVIKVDALAQGKGVVVAKDKREASEALKDFFSGKYLGYPVEKIVIEDMLEGVEASAFALCDGEDFIYLGSASDYKRLRDADEGPNTGGMGTVSPSPVLSTQEEEWVKSNVFAPLLETMKRRKQPFKGFLFAGLMKTEEGFSVLEFNVRLGDPETQSLLPRLECDLVPLLMASATGKLREVEYREPSRDRVALHVVLSAQGYPGVRGETLRKGDVITVGELPAECFFFPAGVARTDQGLVTNGGRVCGVTGLGTALSEVRSKTYEALEKVHFNGAHFRKDIGEKFL